MTSLRTALEHHRAGRLDEAEALYRRLLAANPDHPDSLHLLGVLLEQRGRSAEAADMILRAIAGAPQVAYYHRNLGRAYRSLGRLESAADAYRMAAELGDDDSHRELGTVLAQQGRHAAARASLERAVALNPRDAEALANLGAGHHALGRLDEAIDQYRLALEVNPQLTLVLVNLGKALALRDQFADAAAAFARAAALSPDDSGISLFLGEALQRSGDAAGAIAAYGASGSAEARFRRANLLRERGRLNDAASDYVAALTAAPDHDAAFFNLFSCRNWLCDWPARDAMIAALRARIDRVAAGVGEIESLYPLSVELPYVCDDAALHDHVLDVVARRLAAEAGPPLFAAPRGGRLRIGYVSPDFGEHPISQVCRRLFALHDRIGFEVFCYSLDDRDAGSPLRREIAATCDHFIDLSAADADAAERVAADGIDVLVDLTGYLRRSRPGLFARRPAPVQVYWLGHAGGLRAPYIDYVIADRITVPPGEEDRFVERICRLPDSYHIGDRMEIANTAPPRREFGLPDDAFVFCAFNNPLKIDAEVFAAWMRILGRVDNGVLWLSSGLSGDTAANLRQAAAERGIDPGRIVFSGWLADKPSHLARHALVDLFLDTLRFNASSTTLDALWAGLPVLTVRGSRFYGRISASMLAAIGLEDMICADLAEYEDRAASLASDPAALAAIRARLAANRLTTPLFNTERYVRHLEAAYHRMCATAAAGNPPQSFDVARLA